MPLNSINHFINQITNSSKKTEPSGNQQEEKFLINIIWHEKQVRKKAKTLNNTWILPESKKFHEKDK